MSMFRYSKSMIYFSECMTNIRLIISGQCYELKGSSCILHVRSPLHYLEFVYQWLLNFWTLFICKVSDVDDTLIQKLRAG